MLHERRLALGTAQLGQHYGIANRSGPPSPDEARSILRCARVANIDTLDTAMMYGNSERILGSIGVRGLRIVTKLPPLGLQEPDVTAWVRRRISESLQRLGVESLHALLLHHPTDALGPDAGPLLGALRSLKQEGMVRKIGVSIYDPADLGELMQAMEIDLVQAPYNVLDRRLFRSGWLDRLHRDGVEVHARSAFLQGLLLMRESELPSRFAAWRPLLSMWEKWIREQGLTAVRASLGFVLRTAGIDRVIVGVETAAQLQEIVESARALETDVPSEFACDDVDLIDPSRWKTV